MPELRTYRPTILGFASKVLDKLGMNFIPAGEDTWYSTERTEDRLTDGGGEPNDDRVTAEEYLNSPFERWKASMLNKTNPLVGISRTVIPAAEGTLAATGIQSIPQAVNLVKVARSTPHGILNLVVNAAALTGVGAAGAKVGELVDKQLGGDGSIGQFTFGLGSLYGFNKIPFMRDYNQALSRAVASNYELDNYIVNRGGKHILVPEGINRTLKYVAGAQNGHALLLHFLNAPSIEMHLGGSSKPITYSNLKWLKTNFNEAPSGTYISSFGEATSRSQRISQNGVVKEIFSKNKKTSGSSATVDGYKTIIDSGKHKGYQTDWSDNYYLNRFHDYSSPKDVLFRKLYDNFLLDPSDVNLTNLNNYIVKIGGKPAKYVNGELQIPFPIIYKQ